MSSNCSFVDHISKIKSECRQLIGWVLRTFKSRDATNLLTLWKSFILSKIDYCSILWYPTYGRNISLMQEIESLQRNFTNQIHTIEHLDYWERLKNFNLFSIQRRCERYQIIYAWKIMEGKINCNKTYFATTTIQCRTGRSINDVKPNIIESPIYQLKLRFNCLPKNIRNLTKIDTMTFKKHLDKLLTSIPDQPNVPGYKKYMAASSNSIIDQIKYRQI